MGREISALLLIGKFMSTNNHFTYHPSKEDIKKLLDCGQTVMYEPNPDSDHMTCVIIKNGTHHRSYIYSDGNFKNFLKTKCGSR